MRNHMHAPCKQSCGPRFRLPLRLVSLLLSFAMLFTALPTAAFASNTEVPIDAENFPDAAFRSYVSSEFDKNHNDSLNAQEISDATRIEVHQKGISSLQGIEHFTKLTFLDCEGNHLTELNISSNKKLTYLYCSNNQLTTLDISSNKKLTYLYCSDNQLTALDVSNNTSLQTLSCRGNQLTALDVSSNEKLAFLHCYSNQLTALDVSSNEKLAFLHCYSNQLTTLDVSSNTLLTELKCGNNALTALDLSKNTRLSTVSVSPQKYYVGAEDAFESLSDLPGKPAEDRISSISETNTNESGTNYDQVSYTYDCGNNWQMSVEVYLPYRKDAAGHWPAGRESKKADHTWDSGVVTKEATEAETGIMTYTCTVCGYEKTEDIPALGHNFDPAAWKSDADHHWHECKNGDGGISAKISHALDSGNVTKAATETETGIMTSACRVCGYEKTEDIPVCGHNFDPAVWKFDADSHWHECTSGDGEISDKAAHIWDSGVVTREATETGIRTYTCTVCGRTKTETIAKTYTITVYGGRAYDAGYQHEITSAKGGDTVYLAANNQSFEGWVSEGGTNVEFDSPGSVSTFFTMPDGNVTVRAKGDAAPVPGKGDSASGGGAILAVGAVALAAVAGVVGVVMYFRPVEASGHVELADHTAASGAQLTLSRSGATVTTVTADAEGNFRLAATRGTYGLTVIYTDAAGTVHQTAATIEVPTEGRSFTLS